jgi:hypothetical protein
MLVGYRSRRRTDSATSRPEARNLGLTGQPIPRSTVAVTEDQAIAVARSEHPDLAMTSGETTAHLMSATLEGAPSGVEVPVVDRPIWIVRYAGIHYLRSDPSSPPGAPPPSIRVLDHAYVFIDAMTGEAILTSLTP